MGTIPSYPPNDRPLDGTEFLGGWQDGRERRITTQDVANLARSITGVVASSYWSPVLERNDNYGIYGPNDLRYWALEAGITLGTGNDQPAFDAAHAAMAALAQYETLYVQVPPLPTGLGYQIDQLKIFSRAGFWCAPSSVLLQQKPQTTPQPIVAFGDMDWDDGYASTATA